jgi:hypothetical protein
MAVTKLPPLPNAPIGEAGTDIKGAPVVNVSSAYERYFRDRDDALNTITQPVITPVQTQDAHVSQPTTDLITPESAGLYSFQMYASVQAADGGGASLITTLGWTEQTVVRTHVFSTLDGSLAANNISGTYLFYADANAPITYANAYTTTTPNLFHYNFYALLSSVAGAS